jgi:hypothetical protein
MFFRKFGETKPAAVARRGSQDIGARITVASCDGRVGGGEVVGGIGDDLGMERSLPEEQLSSSRAIVATFDVEAMRRLIA